MKRRLIAIVLSATVILSLAACGKQTPAKTDIPVEKPIASEEGKKDTSTETKGKSESADINGSTLEIAVTYTGDQAQIFGGLIDKFEEEYGCKVNVAEYGDDYENTLKARMAANELPDVFMTHGWSILRYKEYLLDLRDQPWVSDYDDIVFGTIQDDDGSIYVMMFSVGISGTTMVNLDVCEAAGVDPYTIHTWEDFTEACEKIKTSGKVPLCVRSYAGTIANIAGTFISYDGEMYQDSAALLDGTYDWQSFRDSELKYLVDWDNAGYFFDDVLTMNDSDMLKKFASGKGAFIFGNSPEKLVTCLTLNPDGKFAYLPSFASKEGGKEFVGIGEGDAFGIWKDSGNVDAAKILLEYLARPEVANEMNAITGKVGCLKSAMELDDGVGQQLLQDMKNKCADCNILYENLWDREYMPSGMWSIFGNASNMIFDDNSEAGQDAVIEYLRENYQDLYEAALEE